jgi:hypothetical protein
MCLFSFHNAIWKKQASSILFQACSCLVFHLCKHTAVLQKNFSEKVSKEVLWAAETHRN